MSEDFAAAGSPSASWLVSRPFDLLFLANIAWPLLLLMPVFGLRDGLGPLEFAQVYFLTTPHRWITLALVLFDPDRREGRSLLFLGILVVVATAILAVRLSSSQFLCLLLIDFLWNAWHFGSQHAGIARIYSRRCGERYSSFEKHAIRWLVVGSIIKIPGWSEAWNSTVGSRLSSSLDLLLMIIPLILIGRLLTRGRLDGKAAYLGSVCSLYGLMNVARILGYRQTQDSLFLGATLFHAIEYLAIVIHYARGRAISGSLGLFQSMARTWGLVLASFMLVLGLIDYVARSTAFELAVGANLAAAFLHYAYDGMIWKLRRPATARSLGA